MKSITPNEATIMVQRLRTDGNLFWRFRAKVILQLLNDTASVKNGNDLINALRQHGYLECDETMDADALRQFRTEAFKEMLDAEVFFEKYLGTAAQADLKANSNNIKGIMKALVDHVDDLEEDEYLAAVVTA